MSKVCHPKVLEIIVIVKEWYFLLFFLTQKMTLVVCRSDPSQRVNQTSLRDKMVILMKQLLLLIITLLHSLALEQNNN